MNGLRKRELGILLLGDVVAFYISLYGTLLTRYFSIPSSDILYNHIFAFSVLIVLWVVVFLVGGLYDKHTVFFKKRLPQTVIRVQIVNILIAALFFFLVPVGIAPKRNLVIYLVISSALIILWRVFIFTRIGVKRTLQALIVGEGPEVEELVSEVNDNTTRYHFEFVRMVDAGTADDSKFSEKLSQLVSRGKIGIIVAKPDEPAIARHADLLFKLVVLERRVSLVDFSKMYEEIFNRVPLSALTYGWFLRNISHTPKALRDGTKRIIDIFLGALLGLFLLVLLPFIAVLIRIEGKGPIFISQKRIGLYGRSMNVWKLRTMKENKSASAEWTTEEVVSNPVTRVGHFLRKSSIDEWPQAWNILKGEMSLIGPRNDIAGLAERLHEHIPFYDVRTLVKPGITGWAQVNQYYAPGNISPQSIEETKMRLAYDLYYIRHHTLILDVVIVLRTITAILSRFGVSLNVR